MRGFEAIEHALANEFHAAGAEQEDLQHMLIALGLLATDLQVRQRRADNGQQVGGRCLDRGGPGLGNEVLFPEPGVHHVLHGGQAMGLGQQLHGLAEVVAAFAEEHRADAAVERLKGRGRGVPGAFRRPGVGVPFDRFEGFAIVLPVRVDHADGAVLDAVPDEVVDVGHGHAEVRQDAAPIAHAGTDEELVARLGERG